MGSAELLGAAMVQLPHTFQVVAPFLPSLGSRCKTSACRNHLTPVCCRRNSLRRPKGSGKQGAPTPGCPLAQPPRTAATLSTSLRMLHYQYQQRNNLRHTPAARRPKPATARSQLQHAQQVYEHGVAHSGLGQQPGCRSPQ